LNDVLDHQLIDNAKDAIEKATPVEFDFPIRNNPSDCCAMLSGEIARKYGSAGLPENTIKIHFSGSAGQSFGAFGAWYYAYA